MRSEHVGKRAFVGTDELRYLYAPVFDGMQLPNDAQRLRDLADEVDELRTGLTAEQIRAALEEQIREGRPND